MKVTDCVNTRSTYRVSNAKIVCSAPRGTRGLLKVPLKKEKLGQRSRYFAATIAVHGGKGCGTGQKGGNTLVKG